MDNTEKFINHLSLCSGYGGIGRGLKQVLPNVREIAHVEIEAYAVANLVEKMEKGLLVPAPIWSDLKTFNFSAFRESLKYGILSAGFPCQPFSQAGRRKATKDPRHLWPYIIEGIRQCNPMFCFLENVQGIISAKTGDGESVLKYVCGELEKEGYRNATGIFSASEVGAPHQRKRVFILAQLHEILLGDTSNKRRKQNFTLRNKQQTTRFNLVTSKQYKRYVGHSNRSRQQQQKEINEKIRGRFKHASQKWPSRPGEPQHDWEEPRATLKPKLGGATNGPSSGVDANINRIERLTLCGNGVVPQTAALAFVTLLEKLEKMNVENNSDV